jgi:DNA-binding GntR family transcriptional regulator
MDLLKSPPRYEMLARDLRERIEYGDFAPGDKLPSENELAALNGYSRGTVVRAIESLVRQGLVTRRQGSGSFVAHRSLHRQAGQLLSFTKSVASDGHRTSQRILQLRPARPVEARQFGVSPPAIFLERLRYVDGAPAALHRSVLPSSVCRQLPAFESDGAVLRSRDFSLYAHLEQNGLPVEEARERVTARLSTAEEAQMLEIETPAAVTVVFRMSYAGEGRLVEAVEAVYRADLYAYDAHLIRGREIRTGLRVASGKNSVPVQREERELR